MSPDFFPVQLKKQAEITAAQQAAIEAKERAEAARKAKRQAELAEVRVCVFVCAVKGNAQQHLLCRVWSDRRQPCVEQCFTSKSASRAAAAAAAAAGAASPVTQQHKHSGQHRARIRQCPCLLLRSCSCRRQRVVRTTLLLRRTSAAQCMRQLRGTGRRCGTNWRQSWRG